MNLVLLAVAVAVAGGAFAAYQSYLYKRVPTVGGTPLFVEHGCAVWSTLWMIHHTDTVVVGRNALVLNDVLGFMAYYRFESARVHVLDLGRITSHGPSEWCAPLTSKPTNYEVRYAPKPDHEVVFYLRLDDTNRFSEAIHRALKK